MSYIRELNPLELSPTVSTARRSTILGVMDYNTIQVGGDITFPVRIPSSRPLLRRARLASIHLPYRNGHPRRQASKSLASQANEKRLVNSVPTEWLCSLGGNGCAKSAWHRHRLFEEERYGTRQHNGDNMGRGRNILAHRVACWPRMAQNAVKES